MAIMLFSASFYYLTHASVETAPDTTRASSANVQARALGLSDLIVAAGAGWYTSAACVVQDGAKEVDATKFHPDGVSTVSGGEVTGRFGLGTEGCLRSFGDPQGRNNLSYEKLFNLYHAGYAADPSNGYVDYEEAKLSLGMGDNENFHLRTWPLLRSASEVLRTGNKDALARPLYIGDYSESTKLAKVVAHSSSVVDASDRITVRLTIKNDGTEAAILATLFEIPLKMNTVSFTLHTPLLASGAEHTIEFTIRKSSDWLWKSDSEKWITYGIQDRDGSLGGGKLSLSGINMKAASSKVNVFVESTDLYFVKADGGTAQMKLDYMAFQGDGTPKQFGDWKLITTNPLGVPSSATPLGSDVQGEVALAAALTGAYKGAAVNAILQTWNYDYMNVVSKDSDVGRYKKAGPTTYAASDAVVTEAGFLDVLVQSFDAGVFAANYSTTKVPYVSGGDIFPDLKSVMNKDLVLALTDGNGNPSYAYNMVFVGSDVDHTMMTSADAKHAIRNWVLGGGTLVVFGSSQQNVQWLQPLFHASLETANGGLQTPDASHPVLNIPQKLDYAGYTQATQWTYNAGAGERFTRVIGTNGGGDVLAVSNPGAFGDGRIILTSWRPHDLYADQANDCPNPLTADSPCDALFLIHNLLSLSYRYLYLDYGPEMPAYSAVGSELRIVNVYHPELREVVTIQLQVFVFD